HPLGVGGEFGPVFFGFLHAGMRQNVDQRVRPVFGNPIADGLHPMLLEDGDRVIAETGFERGKSSFDGGIGSQLEHAVLLRGGTTGDECDQQQESMGHVVSLAEPQYVPAGRRAVSYLGSANATMLEPEGASFFPPPHTITIYSRPFLS